MMGIFNTQVAEGPACHWPMAVAYTHSLHPMIQTIVAMATTAHRVIFWSVQPPVTYVHVLCLSQQRVHVNIQSELCSLSATLLLLTPANSLHLPSCSSSTGIEHTHQTKQPHFHRGEHEMQLKPPEKACKFTWTSVFPPVIRLHDCVRH